MIEKSIRINIYLRDQGLVSRRGADTLIKGGKIFINGKRACAGMRVGPTDKVELKLTLVNEPLLVASYEVSGNKGGVYRAPPWRGSVYYLQPHSSPSHLSRMGYSLPASRQVREDNKENIYLAYNKPRGLATQGPTGSESVITAEKTRGLFPIGRLDKESEGLLILTNDGRITGKLLGDKEMFEKEYVVKVREPLRAGIPAILAKGMHTKSLGTLLPAKATLLDKHTINITLREGKRHQIRVMLSELGYTVIALKRVRVGAIHLGKLVSGASRPLTEKEVAVIL